MYSGRQELDFGKRLDNWQQLAMYFDISDDQQKRFKPGDEPYEIWKWLKARNMLAELPEALRYIGREDIVVDILEPPSIPAPASEAPWQGSPFPGLRHFTVDDAVIFFGCTQETTELLERLRRERFVAVVGAYGGCEDEARASDRVLGVAGFRYNLLGLRVVRSSPSTREKQA